jgi:hypothetical protein
LGPPGSPPHSPPPILHPVVPASPRARRILSSPAVNLAGPHKAKPVRHRPFATMHAPFGASQPLHASAIYRAHQWLLSSARSEPRSDKTHKDKPPPRQLDPQGTHHWPSSRRPPRSHAISPPRPVIFSPESRAYKRGTSTTCPTSSLPICPPVSRAATYPLFSPTASLLPARLTGSYPS